MSRLNLAALFAALLLTAAGTAEAKQWKYAGMHPRTGQPADGLCHIEITHVHTAAPVNADVLYRTHDGVYVFIGDPTPFGYEGPRHAFYGHHPVVLNVIVHVDADKDDVAYCYHDGPHYHAYEPPPHHRFVEKEDVSYYAGDYPDDYQRERPKLIRINSVYRTWNPLRPAVRIAPPPEYHGPIFQVDVHLPVPRVEVTVGSPPPPPPPPQREVVIIREERVVHDHDDDEDDDDDHHHHGHGNGHHKHKHKGKH
ncbi:hypothetical protein JY651_43405 [Pyxidicoccus parkwayensis]|uniref:Uncharacterized protein n=1 Tax=Pyxidicoccus parkwayensis TaxID=2813578 RepID=A0ABX7NWS7_9BACT|nr:hypothetical protein [Pyxidicoccus parkwaysis]QSQ21925.1 hypothetical protein JY651_43405 [Pyxidicoccus parkwaysis]